MPETVTINLADLDPGDTFLGPLTWRHVVTVLAKPERAKHFPWRKRLLADLADEVLAQTEPKPEEPTGLGAVVRDSADDHWVRDPHYDTCVWRSVTSGDWVDYSDIAVAEILFPGVTL